MTRVNIFVSHEHKDAALLSNLKNIFSFHGINFFLAHQDIAGGENYIKVINTALDECDIFLLYANEQSKKSIFCNQEIGWAKSKQKPFLIIIDSTTKEFHWGLMDQLQATAKIFVEYPDYDKVFLKVIDAVMDKINKPIFSKYKEIISNLKSFKYNGFFLYKPNETEKRRISISLTSPCHDLNLFEDKINLVPDGWNDSGYYTTFHIYLGKSYLGKIKICYAGQMKGQHTYDQLPEKFLFLPRNFLSASIDMDKDDFLPALQYLLNDYNVMERHPDLQLFYNSNVVSNSIFRENPNELQKFRSQNARPSPSFI